MVKSTRLYARAVFTGYRRSRHTQRENQSLIKIDGVRSSEDAKWYLGKRVVYSYRAKTLKNGKKVNGTKNIIGKVIATHGATGTVRTKFNVNLPSQALGHLIKVMMYPHRPS